jgi:hypothetical protein
MGIFPHSLLEVKNFSEPLDFPLQSSGSREHFWEEQDAGKLLQEAGSKKAGTPRFSRHFGIVKPNGR